MATDFIRTNVSSFDDTRRALENVQRVVDTIDATVSALAYDSDDIDWATDPTQSVTNRMFRDLQPIETFSADQDETVSAGTKLVIWTHATTAGRTLTLPTAASVAGRTLYIKVAVSLANNLTVDGAGSENIDGAANRTMTAGAYRHLNLVSDGSDWFVIGEG